MHCRAAMPLAFFALAALATLATLCVSGKTIIRGVAHQCRIHPTTPQHETSTTYSINNSSVRRAIMIEVGPSMLTGKAGMWKSALAKPRGQRFRHFRAPTAFGGSPPPSSSQAHSNRWLTQRSTEPASHCRRAWKRSILLHKQPTHFTS